jgi:type I restriction enzyme S subunit
MSQLPTEWLTASLGDLQVEARSGFPSGRHNSEARGVPHLRPMNISRFGNVDFDAVKYVESPRDQRVRQGDVLFNNTNSPALVGKTAYFGYQGDWAYSNHMTRLRPPAGLDARFLAIQLHYLWQCGAFLRLCSNHVNQASVSSKTLLQAVRIVLPPTAEQERIVVAIEEQLSRLDAAVAALGRVRQNLRRMRATVLESAVSGRLVPQDPRDGSGAELLASIEIEPRRSKRKGTELVGHTPAVPATWATAPWAAIGHSQNGRAFPSAEYSTEGRRLLRPGNLHSSGDVVWSATNTRCLPERYAVEFPDYLVGENEIVMNLTAQSLRDEFLGRVCMMGQGGAALLNQRIARLTPVGMNARFVMLVLKSPFFRSFVSQLNTGSLIQHMFTWQVDQFIFPIPPRREQDRIVASIDKSSSMLDALDHLAAHAQTRAHRLRSAILDAAFSGKLVPQDPNDEPASVLLERIATEGASSGGRKPVRVRRQRRATVIT